MLIIPVFDKSGFVCCAVCYDSGADLLAINANGNMPYDLCEDVTALDFIESEMTRQGICHTSHNYGLVIIPCCMDYGCS